MTGIADATPGFHIAPFAFDGELQGVELLPYHRLSPKWLQECEAVLDSHGAVFHASWPGTLSHIRTRCTSASGAALLTFETGGAPVTSIALASGTSHDVDSQILSMFVRSLRGLHIVRSAARSAEPFQQALTIRERPLMVVLTWPIPGGNKKDADLVRELSLHLAAAFFRRVPQGKSLIFAFVPAAAPTTSHQSRTPCCPPARTANRPRGSHSR